MKEELITYSEAETMKWAEAFGAKSRRGDIYALYGELGAGKTIVAKGIAKGMGIIEEINSPTFLLLEIYEGQIDLYHFDLYRIENYHELDELLFEEYWDGDGVSIIEWADKAGERIPENSIKIHIEWINSNERRIKVEYPDN